MSILQWIKKRCLDPDSSSELFDEVDFDTTDNDQATVERECPPPLFELQFDEHFESDCVTEDEVDIENIKLLNFIVYNSQCYFYIYTIWLLH